MDLLDKLGIDWKLLVAQTVNFLIVLGVLYQFLYKPLIKFLEQRRARIEASLKEAQRIEGELKALEIKRDEVLGEARKAAQALLKQAEAQAETQRQETLVRVKGEAEKVIAEARGKLESEQAVALLELRREAARLVTQAVTKLVGKLPGAELDKKLVEEAVAEVAKR
jgi:F-type H+-transporting ATPase subunit b